MDNKKKNNRKGNNSACWILDDNIRDVLTYFFIELELNDIKNIRLVCRKFQSVIDNNCDRLFNLIFRLRINKKMKKQELEEIIIKNPIIISFFLYSKFDDENLIGCIPDYTKELKLYEYQDKNLREYKFSSSLESLYLEDCKLPLNCWNSIPSSLSSFTYYITMIENIELTLIGKFAPNLKKLDISNIDLTKLKIWPQNLVHLRLLYSNISSDKILNLSTLSTLLYFELRTIKGITEINLLNFNSLKSLTYIPGDDNQHIYFPSSLQTLILYGCRNENVKLTKLPNSLIHLEINNSYPDFISFLLKEENKLPLLQSFSIYNWKYQLKDEIPKILHQYDRLKLLIFPSIYHIIFNKKENLKSIFSYIPPNLSELRIHECPQEYTEYIINLFPLNCFKQFGDCGVHSGYNSLFFSFTKK